MSSIDEDVPELSAEMVEIVKAESEEVPRKSRKITIVVDEDDPCLKDKVIKEKEPPPKEEPKEPPPPSFPRTPGNDPRFQQQNQTLRCYVMYTDYYRCKHILGDKSEPCEWFKRVFTSICPKAWVERWDALRVDGRLPWHKYKTQGNFPGSKYGD